MKSKLVDSIASNDQHVKCRIFDGDIPADSYWQDMARLERGQKLAERRRFEEIIARQNAEILRLRS